MNRTTKSITVALSAALVLGAVVVGPADAKKKKKKKPRPPVVAACPTFTPVPPEGIPESEEVAEAEITMVTDEATEESPLVLEYEHGPAMYEPRGIGEGTPAGEPLHSDTVWFNLQVDSALPDRGLYIRQEWASPSPDDIDLYLYDSTSAQVDNSGAFNATPVDAVVLDFSSGGRGGNGYESIPGHPATDCAGFTVESRAYATMGQAMTLTVWLGDPQAPEEQP